MMKVRSAPNLSIFAGTGGRLSSNAVKRNRSETPPPPSEKRNRVEYVHQPRKAPPSPPLVEEVNRCNCVRIGQIKPISWDDLPEEAKLDYLKLKEHYGARWDELDMDNHTGDDDLIGAIGLHGPDPDPGFPIGFVCSDPEPFDLIKDLGFLDPDLNPMGGTAEEVLDLFS